MKIVAIGGGDIEINPPKDETKKIDQEIIKLSGKKSPRVLFIPKASKDSLDYIENIKHHFGKRLGCIVDILYLHNIKITKKEIEEKIFNTDIIYVGGGNTLMMLNLWKKHGIDLMLKKAGDKGIVLSGLSAGCNCWFKYSTSDAWRTPKNTTADLIRIKGLNFINALSCPHYDVEKDRKPYLKKIMKKTPGVAIALENCCAIEIIDDKYRIISSKKNANAYITYWKKGKYIERKMEQVMEFRSLNKLLNPDLSY